MNTNRQDRVEQILQSVEGIQHAEAPPFLLTRIEARLSDEREPGLIAKRKVGLILGSAILLAALNLSVVLSSSSSKTEGQAISQPVAAGSYVAIDNYNFDLY